MNTEWTDQQNKAFTDYLLRLRENENIFEIIKQSEIVKRKENNEMIFAAQFMDLFDWQSISIQLREKQAASCFALIKVFISIVNCSGPTPCYDSDRCSDNQCTWTRLYTRVHLVNQSHGFHSQFSTLIIEDEEIKMLKKLKRKYFS